MYGRRSVKEEMYRRQGIELPADRGRHVFCGLLVVIMVCMLAGKVIVPGVCARIRCTEPVTGKIAGFEVHRVTGRRGSHNVFYPVYAYTYDGIYYENTYKSPVTLEPDPPPAGSEVTVYINPENPAEYYDRKQRDTTLILTGVAAMFFTALAIAAFMNPARHNGN